MSLADEYDVTKIETVDYAQSELAYNYAMQPSTSSAIASLNLKKDSYGLDLGCGPGGLFAELVKAIGENGSIVGLDASRPHLEHARQEIKAHSFEKIIKLEWADLCKPLPFEDDTFDWVWSADVLWPSSFDNIVAVVKEAARITKRGGIVALFSGNFHRSILLPGYAHIERCLNTAAEIKKAQAKYQTDSFPIELHNENMLYWLRASAINNIQITAHVACTYAPLKAQELEYLTNSFNETSSYSLVTQEEALEVGLSAQDWVTWKRLSNPNSAEFLPLSPDYYYVRIGTLAWGTK